MVIQTCYEQELSMFSTRQHVNIILIAGTPIEMNRSTDKGCKDDMLPNKNLKTSSQHSELKFEFLL